MRIPWGMRKEQAKGHRDTEFSEELSSNVSKDLAAYQSGPDSGIRVDPTPITLGDELKVEYRGLLVQSGAEEVYLHYGFGPGDWRYVQEVPMAMEADGTWSATVQAGEAGRFSFCFRDSAGNWDNNSGRNWSYEIHGGDWH